MRPFVKLRRPLGAVGGCFDVFGEFEMQSKATFWGTVIAAVAVGGVATAQQARVPQGRVQSMEGIKLNPGERLVAIDGVPVNGRGAVTPTAPTSSAAPTGGPVSQATNIVGNLVRSHLPFSHTPGDTALDKANAERQRRGQRPLLPDPQLQALALRKATIAAQRGHKNHIGGSLGGAKCEGVGHTHGRFLSCCLDEPGTYGGAAMVQGADGWYCCLLVR
jgi:hypothetical protein